MAHHPSVRFLDEDDVARVLEEAREVLSSVGVLVQHEGAQERLTAAGASAAGDGRVRLPGALLDAALASAPAEIALYDRDGGGALTLGGRAVHFDPGSAATLVLDWEAGTTRPATTEDCVRFARLTDALPAYALQSTCVVPSDVPIEVGDRRRLCLALQHGRKPLITGVFGEGSLDPMLAMLERVRGGGEALRERPLAVFDCCPTSPLTWSALACAALLRCAQRGVPVELVAVPMTGATAPVTLRGALVQHAAENLAGLALHQLAAPGAPALWGSCASAFDMRHGTTPLGAVESMMLNSACAQVGRHLGLPTHAYLGLSDSKLLDYQAGLESGAGALLAALSGVNVVSGPGMLELVACQSLEKLVLDHEACRAALRAVRGVEARDDERAVDVIEAGVAAGQFLEVPHTRRWFREELLLPGPTIDRRAGSAWRAAGGTSAAERAHAEVERLLAAEPGPGLDRGISADLEELARPVG